MKINEILGIICYLIKDNIQKPSIYEQSTSLISNDKGDKSDWNKKRRIYIGRLSKGESKASREEILKYHDIEFKKEERKISI